jgi:hypothetical protein
MSISQISETEREVLFMELIARISVLSGTEEPNTERCLNFFIEELWVLLCLPRFNYLSFDEVLFAFRLNTECGVKYISGEDMDAIEPINSKLSIDFVSKVLNNYMGLRIGIENLIKNSIDGY